IGNVPIVGSSAVTRGLKLTAVDSAGRRKKVSTILVERDAQVLEESKDNQNDISSSEKSAESKQTNALKQASTMKQTNMMK
ncbi:hypothetical protein CG399_00800, partial [Bifidobacteriaceae bacterium NR015]